MTHDLVLTRVHLPWKKPVVKLSLWSDYFGPVLPVCGQSHTSSCKRNTFHISHSLWRQLLGWPNSRVLGFVGPPAEPSGRPWLSTGPECRPPRPPTRRPPPACLLPPPPGSRRRSGACWRPCCVAGTFGSVGWGRCRPRCIRRGKTWS